MREATELESDSSRVFKLSDGSYKTEVYSGPVQAESGRDTFGPISTCLAPTGELGTFQTVASPASATFAPSGTSGHAVVVERQGVRVGLDMVGSNHRIPYAFAGSARFDNVAPDTDLVYEPENEGLKETVWLNSPDAANSVAFDLTVKGGDLISPAKGLYMIAPAGKKDPVFDIGALTVFDAAGVECTSATTRVTRLGSGRHRFTFVVPPAWLRAPEREFPVAVDPSLAVDNDTFVHEGTNASYGSDPDIETGRQSGASSDDRRGYLRFDAPGERGTGRYVHDATFGIYTNYIQCSSRTYLGRTTQYWNPGDLKWYDDAGEDNGRPTYEPMTSQVLSGLGWSNWDVTDLAQEWLRPIDPVSWAANTLQLYQMEDGTQAAAHYKRFYSENHATYIPKIMIYDEVPLVAARPEKSAYTLSGSDVVTVTATVRNAWPEDIRSLAVRVNGSEGDPRARGEMRWFGPTSTASGLTTQSCPGSGTVGYVTTDTVYTEPLLDQSSYSLETSSAGSTTTITFAFRVKEGWGNDVQVNTLDTRLTMGQGADTFDTGWSKGTSSFNVVPVPVSGETSVTADGLQWRSTSIPNPHISPNDSYDRGRGYVNMTWPQVEDADGYRVWAHDGNAWRQIGSTAGGTATSWSSKDSGAFPIDSAISAMTTDTTASGYRGTSPSLESRLTTLAAGGKKTAAVTVSDGTYLFTRASSDATSWTRVGSGLKSTSAGASMGLVGAPLRAAKSGFYLDGHLYSGCTSSTSNRILEGTWVNEQPGAVASSTVVHLEEPLLSASTGSDAPTGSPDVLVASDGERIYSVSQSRGGGFDGWRVRAFDWDGAYLLATGTVDAQVVAPSYQTAAVIAQPGFLSFVESSTTSAARVTRVRTSDWSVVGQWSLGMADPGSGAWDKANDCIWIGRTSAGEIWRTTAAGVELRDDPSFLYARTAGTERDGRSDYSFAVTAYNSGGDSPLSEPAYVQLPNRTESANDDPRHTGTSFGSAQNNGIGAILDQGALTIDVADLGISSWGPAAGLSRHYDSRVKANRFFAPGWRFNFEETIEESATPGIVDYVDATGERHSFVETGGLFYAPTGFPAVLARTDTGGGYSLTLKDRSVLAFDGDGCLRSETDRNGNAVTYNWSGDRVFEVVAANGQKIELSYDEAGKIDEATYSTAAGTRDVDFNAAAATVTYLPGEVDESYTTGYGYEAGRLATVTVTAAGVEPASWSFEYGTADELVRVHYPITDQDAPGSVEVTYAADSATILTSADVSGTPSTIENTLEWNDTGTLRRKSDPVVSGQAKRWWSYQYGTGNISIVESSPAGAVVRRTIDTSGNTVFEWDEEGHLNSTFYDQYSQPVRVVDPRGCTTYNTFDENGNLIESAAQVNSTEFERASTEYQFHGLPTTERSLLSQDSTMSTWIQTDIAYDEPSGQPFRTEVTAKTRSRNQVDGTYEGDWLTSEISLGPTSTVDQIVTTKDYDDFGNLTSDIDAAGVEQLIEPVYGLSGRLEQVRDVDGVLAVTDYDALGRVTASRMEAVDATRGTLVTQRGTTVYDALSRPVLESALTSQGAVNTSVRHRYDAAGQEVRTIDSIEGTTTSWFDARGNVIAAWAPEAGSPASAPATASARALYDVDGRLISEFDPGKSVAASSTYLANGLVAKTIEPDGSWISYSYDQAGNPTESHAPAEDGSTASMKTVYDIGGRAIEQISSEGKSSRTRYDLGGRAISSIAVSGSIESTASIMRYNELGWMMWTQSSDAAINRATYDILGNVIHSVAIDSSGKTTEDVTNHYDAKKRLDWSETVEGEKLSRVEYVYDAFGRTTSEKHVKGGAVSRWILTDYDEFDRETSVVDVKSGIRHSYSYALGSKKKSTDTGSYSSVNVVNTSDATGRETSQDATFTLSGGSVTASRAVGWDTVRNLPTSTGVAISGVSTTTLLGFDVADKLTTITAGPWRAGGVFVSYNTTGTANKVKDTVTLPWSTSTTSTVRTFGYSKAGRLTTATVSGEAARTIKYKWNAKGTGDLEQVTNGSTVTDFKYGTAGQLATAKTGSTTTTYTFDAAGRRTGWKSPTASQECTWTGDDLVTGWAKKTSTGSVVASAVYDHDGDGQRVSASVLATSPWSATPTTTAYAYGWEGMSLCWQTARSAGAEARLTYLYDETDRAYAASYEATVSGAATSSVIRIMSNDHGDVVGLADAAGEVFARYVYGPFGEAERTYSRATPRISAALAAQITSANPIRYAGYDYDSWAGTYYLQARHYDPTTKQFLSKDPADADGEESSYQYCSGDPIGLVDPSGMWGISLGGLWRRACRTVKRAYRATVRRVNRAVNCVKRVVRTAYRAAKRVVKRAVRTAKRWVRHTVRTVRRAYHRVRRFAKRQVDRAVRRISRARRQVVTAAKRALTVQSANMDVDAPPSGGGRAVLMWGSDDASQDTSMHAHADARADRLRARGWDVSVVEGQTQDQWERALSSGKIDQLEYFGHGDRDNLWIAHKRSLNISSLPSVRITNIRLYSCRAMQGVDDRANRPVGSRMAAHFGGTVYGARGGVSYDGDSPTVRFYGRGGAHADMGAIAGGESQWTCALSGAY